ncbi:MAG: hypothetical protein JWR60_1411 [Polaromonas sp.]|nr:hypothetical protein [Polaromonas sp.]
MSIKHALVTALAVLAPLACMAQAAPAALSAKTTDQASAQPLFKWQAAPARKGAEAYFTNLQNGAKIETPFRATFGLTSGWGLAPISVPQGGKSGHHHLLINRDLPLDFKKALPFDDQYMHFGKGQMETVLTLEPGNYTLRLLLADDKHLPHFVYSKPLKITVTRKNKDIEPASLIKKGISLPNIAPDAKLKSPFTVQFQASGLNVAHLSQKQADSGHFRLTVTPQSGGGKPVEMDFTQGQTEAVLSPPAGSYVLKLDFLDNMDAGKTLAESVSTPMRVE